MHADPVNGTDPSGMFRLAEVAATIAIRARLAASAVVRGTATLSRATERLFPVSMIFNLSVAFADLNTAVEAGKAANYQRQLIKRFKSHAKRAPFAARRLLRLARFLGKGVVSSQAGVPRKANGFPDFSSAVHPHKGTVFIGKLTGSRSRDETKANRIRGMRKPFGYTWHHHEVVGIMQLVRKEVHGPFRHIGGVFYWEVAMNRNTYSTR